MKTAQTEVYATQHLALGNIAISSYMLIALWHLPANASIDRLLLRQAA